MKHTHYHTTYIYIHIRFQTLHPIHHSDEIMLSKMKNGIMVKGVKASGAKFLVYIRFDVQPHAPRQTYRFALA